MLFRILILIITFTLNSKIYAKPFCKSREALDRLEQLQINRDAEIVKYLNGLNEKTKKIFYEVYLKHNSKEEITELLKFLSEKVPSLNLNEKQTQSLIELLQTDISKKMTLKYFNSVYLKEENLKAALDVYENPKTFIYVGLNLEQEKRFADVQRIEKLRKGVAKCVDMCEQTLKSTRFFLCLKDPVNMCSTFAQNEGYNDLKSFAEYLTNINNKASKIGLFLYNNNIDKNEVFLRVQKGCYANFNSCDNNFLIARAFSSEAKITKIENVIQNVQPVLGIDRKRIKSYILDDIFNPFERGHSSISNLDKYEEHVGEVFKRLEAEVKSISTQIREKVQLNPLEEIDSIEINLEIPEFTPDLTKAERSSSLERLRFEKILPVENQRTPKVIYIAKPFPQAKVSREQLVLEGRTKASDPYVQVRSGLTTFVYNPEKLPCPRTLNCIDNDYFVELDIGISNLQDGRRGSIRMVMNKKTGDVFVSFDHYETFHYLEYLSPNIHQTTWKTRKERKRVFAKYPHIEVIETESL